MTKIVLKSILDPNDVKSVKVVESNILVTSSKEPIGTNIDDVPDNIDLVDEDISKQNILESTGLPKSGREWKSKQAMRHSATFRQGDTSFNLSKTQSHYSAVRARRVNLRELEAEMKQESKDKALAAKAERVEREQRKAANLYKSAKVQAINPEKVKKMSKKQLRMIKKTVMGKDGQLELVPVY